MLCKEALTKLNTYFENTSHKISDIIAPNLAKNVLLLRSGVQWKVHPDYAATPINKSFLLMSVLV